MKKKKDVTETIASDDKHIQEVVTWKTYQDMYVHNIMDHGRMDGWIDGWMELMHGANILLAMIEIGSGSSHHPARLDPEN